MSCVFIVEVVDHLQALIEELLYFSRCGRGGAIGVAYAGSLGGSLRGAPRPFALIAAGTEIARNKRVRRIRRMTVSSGQMEGIVSR